MRLDIGTGATTSPWGGTTPVVTTVANLTNGSVNILTGTVTNVGTLVGAGTLSNIGSVNTVTTVSNVTNGSINILTGTVNSLGTAVGVGTLSNIGSVNTVTAVTTVTTVSNLTQGTVRMSIGTLTTGTLQNLVSGTVNIDPTPATVAPLSFGTLGTAGGSFFGTLSGASGAGTKQYVTGLSVIGQAGTADVRILAGTSIQGTGVLGAGNVVPGGGYIRDFIVPFATGTNSELSYHFVGAGTAFIVVNYWKGA